MDLRRLTLEDTTQWIDSHDVSYAKLQKKKAALLRAEQTWDALETGTLSSLVRRKRPPPVSVKVPEVRKDFWRMNMIDLNQWIRSPGITINTSISKKKKKCINLAESIWDAIQNGTLEDLKEECKSKRGISKTRAV